MFATSIWWILVVSGAVTGGAGVAALLFPQALLRLAFGVSDCDAPTKFFVRHWGVLIAVVGALVFYAALAPVVRAPVLVAAAGEKIAIVLVIFFGPLKRTTAMTAIAATDGLFAVLYVAYLSGL